MKKYFILIVLAAIAITVFPQNDSIQPPYKKVPVFPPLKLVLPGNAVFTKDDLPKKKPVMLMVFSPMCEHCRHETEEILKNFDQFNNSVIVMATMMPYDSMMNFREKYNLASFKNIIVGQDTQFFLPGFYMMNNLPFLAFYDRKRKLISAFEGTMPVEQAAAELQKHSLKE